MIKNLLLSIFSLIFILLLCEAGFRALEYFQLIPPYGITQMPPDPGKKKYSAKFMKTDNPHMVYRFDPKDKRVNQQGFRDDNFVLDKAENEFRIAVLGDSVAFAFGIPRNKGVVDLLENSLNQAVDGNSSTFNVMNFSVVGYDTRAEVETYKEFVRPYKPDLVLLGFVLNDTMTPRSLVELNKDKKRAAKKQGQEKKSPSRVTLLLARSHLLVWVNHARSKHSQKNMSDAIYHATYRDEDENWIRVRDAAAELVALAAEDDFELAVVIFPLLDDYEQYQFVVEHEKVARMFSEHGVPVLDLLPAFGQHHYLEYFRHPSDPTHPNELGHQVAADAIQDFLFDRNLLAVPN